MIALARHDDWSLVGRVGAAHFSPRVTETQRVLFQLATTKSPTWSPAPSAQPETANQIETGTVQTNKAPCTLMERREEAFYKIIYGRVRCFTSGLVLNPPSINMTVTRSVGCLIQRMWICGLHLLKIFCHSQVPFWCRFKVIPLSGPEGFIQASPGTLLHSLFMCALHFSLWQAVGAERGPPALITGQHVNLKGLSPL